MGRLARNVVDYFPHDSHSSEGDTLTILQNRFHNDGYAFWFKLLERLSSSEGHYIECSNPVKWQVLLAKLGVDEFLGVEIMNLLVEMKAIDPELWQSRVIWCQNLVNNLSEVYKNRNRSLPQKPIVKNKNAITTPNLPIEMLQSRVEEIKEVEEVDNNKGNGHTNQDFTLPEYIDNQLWNDFMDMRSKKKVPNTDRAKSLLIAKLSKFHNDGFDTTKIIEDSIERGWTSVFLTNEVMKNGTKYSQTNNIKDPFSVEELKASVGRHLKG
jgi:hypothetical protein